MKGFLEDEARAGGFCAKYRDPCPSSSSWSGAVLPWWWLVAEVVVAILTRRDACSVSRVVGLTTRVAGDYVHEYVGADVNKKG